MEGQEWQKNMIWVNIKIYPNNHRRIGKSFFNRMLYISILYEIWAILWVKYSFYYLLRTKLNNSF